MPFPNTIKLIHEYNTNPSAKLPNKFSIQDNEITTNDGLKMSNNHKDEIRELFLKECKENNKNGIYFHGCLKKTFIKHYNSELENFLETLEDGEEVDFISLHLKMGMLKFEFPYLNTSDRFDIMLSLKKRLLFLEDRLNFLGYSFKYNRTPNENSTFGYDEKFKIERKNNIKNGGEIKSNLKWKRSKNDLIELISGLIETKAFGDVDDKEIIETIGRSFNKKIKGYKQAESQIRKRVKDLTIFLDIMKLKIEQRKIRLEENNKANKNKN